jgi:hypothetical protein
MASFEEVACIPLDEECPDVPFSGVNAIGAMIVGFLVILRFVACLLKSKIRQVNSRI